MSVFFAVVVDHWPACPSRYTVGAFDTYEAAKAAATREVKEAAEGFTHGARYLMAQVLTEREHAER